MKKPFFKTKIGIILKSIGLGAVKGVGGPVGGIVSGAVNEVVDNVNSPEFGEGAVDWPRLIGYIGGLVLFFFLTYMLVKGEITIDEFEKLWKLFN